MEFKKFDLQMFADTHGFDLNVQTTLMNGVDPYTNDLSPEMKVYYSDYLIDLAEGKLVHDQFGQKHPIPANGGKTIEFRKYDSLPKNLKTLTEGVTPDGQNLNVTKIEATVDQYGDYVTLSDVLMLTAIDNNLVQATKLIGSQAGRTLDTITREVINAGTNVRYCPNGDTPVTSRHAIASNSVLTVKAIQQAVRDLKAQNAETIDGSWVAIIHPDVAYDLMRDSEWVNASLYAGSTQLFNGEIGRIAGVRFVETTEAKIFKAEPLASTQLYVNGAVTASDPYIGFDGGTVAEDALIGRKILVDGNVYTVTDNDASKIYVSETLPAIRNDKPIYAGEAGRAGIDVYSTLVLADNAYGVTDVTGGGLQHIVKQLGTAGTADPLNQRATVGWKAIKTAEILVQQYMIRIESASSYGSGRDN